MTDVTKRLKFPLNLQLFSEDPKDPPADPKDPPADPPKKLELTQDELDALIEKRLARDRKGREDYDEIKAKIADYEKAEEERKKAAMTEKERLEAERADALKKAQEAEDARSKTLDAANQRIIRTELRLMAKELGVRSDALEDVFVLADRSAVTMDADGNVVGAKEAVEALLQAKPYLAEAPKKEPKKIGGGTNPDDKSEQKTKEQLLAEAAEKARKSGRISDQVAYAALKAELSK